jgi:hypothetical protein
MEIMGVKFYNYAIITSTLAFLFELAGIELLNTSDFLTKIGLSTAGNAINGTTLFASILAISVGVGLIAGAITRTKPENYIIWPIIVSVVPLMALPLIGISTAAKDYGGWVYYFTLMVSGVLSFGFVVSVLEFFRGSD